MNDQEAYLSGNRIMKQGIGAAICLLTLVFAGCAGSRVARRQETAGHIQKLKYLNTFVLPHNQNFEGTTVGGLSGIDFDRSTKTFYLISDDRSSINPARFYTAGVSVSSRGIDSVWITGVHTLRQQDGSAYPKLAPHVLHTTDPEAMRYNPVNGTLIWTSEGERIVEPGDTTLIDPSINVISRSGKYTDSLPLPANLRMQAVEKGPVRNGVLEALSFADHFRTLYVSLEEPLQEDGPRAALHRNGAFVRMYRFDLNTKKNTAQYAYELEPVPFPAAKPEGEISSGIPDILWLGNKRLLVTERAYSQGRKGTNIKVFIASLKAAQNIQGISSLKQTPAHAVMKKELLLDMDKLGIYVDNIEGATFGPALPNGHKTIVFVSDNNFNPQEQTQFMLFEIIP